MAVVHTYIPRWFHHINIATYYLFCTWWMFRTSQFLALMKNAVDMRKRPLWTKSSEKQAQLDVPASRRRRGHDPSREVLILFVSVGQCCLVFWEKQSHEERDGVRECLRNWKQRIFFLWARLGRKSRLWSGGGDAGESQGSHFVPHAVCTLQGHIGKPWPERFWDGTSECLGLCSGQSI